MKKHDFHEAGIIFNNWACTNIMKNLFPGNLVDIIPKNEEKKREKERKKEKKKRRKSVAELLSQFH